MPSRRTECRVLACRGRDEDRAESEVWLRLQETRHQTARCSDDCCMFRPPHGRRANYSMILFSLRTGTCFLVMSILDVFVHVRISAGFRQTYNAPFKGRYPRHGPPSTGATSASTLPKSITEASRCPLARLNPQYYVRSKPQSKVNGPVWLAFILIYVSGQVSAVSSTDTIAGTTREFSIPSPFNSAWETRSNDERQECEASEW